MTKTRIQKLKWALFALFISFCAAALGFVSAFHKSLSTFAYTSGKSLLTTPSSQGQITNGSSGGTNYYYYSLGAFDESPGSTRWASSSVTETGKSSTKNDYFLNTNKSQRRTGVSVKADDYKALKNLSTDTLRQAKYLNYTNSRVKTGGGTDNFSVTYQCTASGCSDVWHTGTNDNLAHHQNDSTDKIGETQGLFKYTIKPGTAYLTFLLYYVTIELGSDAQAQLATGAIGSISATVKTWEFGCSSGGDARGQVFMAFAKGDKSDALTNWKFSGQDNKYFYVDKDHTFPSGSSGSELGKLSVSNSKYEKVDNTNPNLLVIGFFARVWNDGKSGHETWLGAPYVSSFSVTPSPKSLYSGVQYASKSTGTNSTHQNSLTEFKIGANDFATANGTALASNANSLKVRPTNTQEKLLCTDNDYFFMGFDIYWRKNNQGSDSPIHVYRKELTIDDSAGADIYFDDFYMSPLSQLYVEAGYGQIALTVNSYEYTGAGVEPKAELYTSIKNGLFEYPKGYFRKEFEYQLENGTITSTAPSAVGNYNVRVKVYYDCATTAVSNPGRITYDTLYQNSKQHFKNNMQNSEYDYDALGANAIALGQSSWKSYSITKRNVSVTDIQNTVFTFDGNYHNPTFTPTVDKGGYTLADPAVTGSSTEGEPGGKQRNVKATSDSDGWYYWYTFTLDSPSYYKFASYNTDTVKTLDDNTVKIRFIINRKTLNWSITGSGDRTYTGGEQNTPYSKDGEIGFVDKNKIRLADDVGTQLTGTDVGTYTVKYVLEGDDLNNYTFDGTTTAPYATPKTTISTDWRITPAKITVAPVVHLTYNGKKQATTFTTDGWCTNNNPDDTEANLLTASIPEYRNVDENGYSATLTLNTNNYVFQDGESNTFHFTWYIDKAKLTFTAKDKSKVYGDAVPANALEGGSIGFDINNYTVESSVYSDLPDDQVFNRFIVLTCTVNDLMTYDWVTIHQYTPVRETPYEIMIGRASEIPDDSKAKISEIENNYEIKFISGGYKVTPRPFNYTVHDETINYGENVTLTGSTTDDVLRYDLEERKVVKITLSHGAETSGAGYLNAGDYKISMNFEGEGVGCYKFSGTPGTPVETSATLTVNEKTVQVRLNNFTVIYGDTSLFDDEWNITDDTKWEITAGEFFDGDDAHVLPRLERKPVSGKLEVTNHDAKVYFGGTDARNYNVDAVYTGGKKFAVVTVDKKPVTYRLDSTNDRITGVYGETYRRISGSGWQAVDGMELSGRLVNGDVMAYNEDVSMITDNLLLVQSDVGGCGFTPSDSGHLVVGSYPLFLSLKANCTAAANYEVTFDKNGVIQLEVTARPIGMQIHTMSATYGDFYPENIKDSVDVFGTLADGETFADLFSYEILNGTEPIDTEEKDVEWEGRMQRLRFITATPGSHYQIKVKKADSATVNNYDFSSDDSVETFTVKKRFVSISITGLDAEFGTEKATVDGINSAIANCINVTNPMDALFPEFTTGKPFVMNTSALQTGTLYQGKYFAATNYNLPISVMEGYEEKYGLEADVKGVVNITKGRYPMGGVSFPDASFVYDGQAHRPELKGTLPTGIDGSELIPFFEGYEVKEVNDGTTTFTVSFTINSDNYFRPDPMNATVTITPRPISVRASDQSAEYCGDESGLNFDSTLYTITSPAGTLITGDSLRLVLAKEPGETRGTYKITFVNDGNPNYEISKTIGTFTVNPRNINNPKVEVYGVNTDGYVYTGKPITPTGISVADRGLAAGHQMLQSGRDYYLGYNKHTNVARDAQGNVLAEAELSFSGQGNFSGTFVMRFMILPKEISTDIYVGAISPMTYNGEAQTPTSFEVKDNGREVTLGNADFTVSYEDNIEAGASAQIILTGKGNYTGIHIVYYTIQRCDVKNLTVAPITDRIYNRNQFFPTTTVTMASGRELLEGTDFTYTYGDNVNVGKGIVNIVGRGNFTGTRTEEFQILPRTLTVDTSKVGNIVYSGTPKDLTVSFLGCVKDDAEPGARFVYWKGSNRLGEVPPTDVGEYLAEVYLADGVINYTIEATGVTFQITPYEVKANWTIPQQMVYNGSEQPVLCDANMGLGGLSVKADIAVVYYFVNGTTETKVDAPRGAGTYRAVAELDKLSQTSKNFTLTGDTSFPTEKTFTIEKAKLTVTPALYTKSFGDPDGERSAKVQGLGGDGDLIVKFTRNLPYVQDEEGAWRRSLTIDWRKYEQVSAEPYSFDNVQFESELYDADYELNISNGEGSGLRIVAREIPKVAPTKEKFYMQDDPDFIEEWDSGYFGIKATITYIRATGENVGTYSFVSFTMKPDSAERDLADYENFSVNFARDGARNKFTILPVHVKYQIRDQFKAFGAEDPVLKLDGDDPDVYKIVEEGVATPNLTVTVQRAEGESVISVGYFYSLTLSNPNYIAEIDREMDGWGGRLYIQRLQIETTDNIEYERTYNGTKIVTATSVDNNIPDAYRAATNFRVVANFAQSNVGEGLDIYIHYEVNERVANNYELPEDRIIEGKGKITPRTLKVWIDDFVMTYGDDVPEITLRYDNFISGEQASTVVVTAPTVKFGNFGKYAPVGTYVIGINEGGESLYDNYVFDVTDTATVIVNRAPITVTVNEEKGTFIQTVSDNKEVEVGNEWFSFSGLKNGDTATVTHKATFDSLEPGNTAITVEFSESDNGNYYLLNRFVSLPAYLKPLPVIRLDNVTAVYSGEPVSVTPYVTVIKPENGSILTVGYTVRYVGVGNGYDSNDAPVNAGTYNVIVESQDDYYDTVTTVGRLKIDKAPVRIFFNGNFKQTYGDFRPLTAVARGTDQEFDIFVSYPFADLTRPKAGTYTVVAKFNGNANYITNSLSAELIIQPRAIQVEFSDFSNLVYNGQPQPITATFTGVLEGDECEPVIVYSSGRVPKDAGTYNATAMPSNSCYVISGNMMQVYSIQKRKLTITANGGTVNAGEKPDTQLVFDGFVSGEGVGDIKDLPNVSISGVSVGENNIHLSGGSDDNYDFVLETGTFTVVYEKATAQKSSGSVIWIVISSILGVSLLIAVIALVARRKQESEYSKERRSHHF